MNIKIRQCTHLDLDLYACHCIEHMREKGMHGGHAHPFPSNHPWNVEEYKENLSKKWSLPAFSPNWEIAWVAIQDNQFLGHLNLRCGGIEAAKHRMRLGMGILNQHRSQGIGKALIEEALNWAKAHKEIDWIDLSVFSKNEAAQKLYTKFGFKPLFTIQDALRVEDEIIDDIQMVLKIEHS